MKQAIKFALSFGAISLLLTWLWLPTGRTLYAEMMTPLANAIYDFIGLSGHGTMQRARFINLVPFTALMLLTPRLPLRRRLGGFALGVLVLMTSHIVLNGVAVMMQTKGHLPRAAMLISDAMPFVLWFVFAREFVSEAMSKIQKR